MIYTPKILAFAGSTRIGSYNKMMVKVAVEGAKKAGADVTYIDLRDYPIPLYDADLDSNEGFPENAKRLKKLFIENDGFLIATPEYNSAISGVLKNAIDWVSRKETPEEPLLDCFRKKVISLMSASPGGFGGIQALLNAKWIFSNMGGLVIPEQVSIPKIHVAFNLDGTFKDEINQKNVENQGIALANMIKRLNNN